MIAQLPQPAGHLGDLAIGTAVTGAAAEQDDAGGSGIGHVQLQHGVAQIALEDAQERVAGAQVRGIQEGDAGVGLLRRLDRQRHVDPDMAGGIEDQWHHQYALAATCGLVQAGHQQC